MFQTYKRSEQVQNVRFVYTSSTERRHDARRNV